jgi:hypothetical protein
MLIEKFKDRRIVFEKTQNETRIGSKGKLIKDLKCLCI